VAPTSGWETATTTAYNNSFWGQYYTTPAAPGNYYVWVETTTGQGLAVSSFTVTVT
jgi:hypothetical protein